MAGKKQNYNKSHGPHSAWYRKETRREEAIERQKARERRSDSEQYLLIQDRPGNSKRESEKLLVRSAKVVEISE